MTDATPETGAVRRLVILGCGYLGRAVAEAALAAGWTVEALTRNAGTAARLRAERGLRVVEGDLAGDAWHGALDPRGATVLDCVSSGGGGLEGYRRSYLEGMQSILRWAGRDAVRAILYTGSTSVYGDAAGAWLDEAAAEAAGSPYAEILLATEAALASGVSAGAVPSGTVLRLAGIYGPGRQFFLDTLRGEGGVVPGHGDYFLNLIHRDDAVAAILRAAEAARPGFAVFNVADDAPAQRVEIARWVAARLGRPEPVFRPEVQSERMRRRGQGAGRPPNRRIANGRLRAALGWAPAYPDFRAGYGALLAAADDSQPA